ncbi:serine protease nudel [Octopus vulgaris]|uniref:Serine protease nudel n=1 Tax=Octopus vulgaris TaxID=6645 RepID=A0AA36ARJ0_OCTVU|nr:serine protease nudel [Octopus vulgaris]
MIPRVIDNFHERLQQCVDNDGCGKGKLPCQNGTCIKKILFNDGVNDCFDNSDEAKRVDSPCQQHKTCCRCTDFIQNSECVANKCRCLPGHIATNRKTKCVKLSFLNIIIVKSRCDMIVTTTISYSVI